MTDKITSIAELKKVDEKVLQYFLSKLVDDKNTKAILEALMIAIGNNRDKFEASVKDRIEITKEEAETILILCREAESRCGLRYEENNLYEKLYEILDKETK